MLHAVVRRSLTSHSYKPPGRSTQGFSKHVTGVECRDLSGESHEGCPTHVLNFLREHGWSNSSVHTALIFLHTFQSTVISPHIHTHARASSRAMFFFIKHCGRMTTPTAS